MNKYNLINKKLNRRGVEILRNLELLLNINDNEKKFMYFFENTWVKKYKKLFNYSILL